VIGAGLAAENFIFALAGAKSGRHSVIQLADDVFYPACSLRSTAVVAARGVSLGHSELGDTLFQGYQRFQKHVLEDNPQGVFVGEQWSGVSRKIPEFKKRYPQNLTQNEIPSLGIELATELCLSSEPCYIIDPALYLGWLKDQSVSLPIERYKDIVINIQRENELWVATSLSGKIFKAENLFLGLGSYQRFWKEFLPVVSKPVHGSYLVYENISWGVKSFSLTLNGHNLIYRSYSNELVIGSTSEEGGHFMASESELREIDQDLRTMLVNKSWPSFEKAKILTGIREKGKGRRPYLESKDRFVAVGGLYKNGFSLALYLAEIARAHLKED